MLKIFSSLFLLFSLTTVTIAQENTLEKPTLLLAKQYHQYIPDDISQYLVSEKLDGIRAYWNGTDLVSKQGKPFTVPHWFIKDLPKNIKLDGELWLGRHQFEKTMSIVTSYDKDWANIRYMIFDLPHNKQPFQQRYQKIKQIVKQINKPHVQFIEQTTIPTKQALEAKLENIVSLGGEGLMLHKKTAYYHAGRSQDLLKLKPIYDAESIVIGHTKGKGKNKGLLGALIVEVINNSIQRKHPIKKIQFKIGTGFTQLQRKNPPKLGDIITFQYQGFTNTGIPKFARFLRIRQKSTHSPLSKSQP